MGNQILPKMFKVTIKLNYWVHLYVNVPRCHKGCWLLSVRWLSIPLCLKMVLKISFFQKVVCYSCCRDDLMAEKSFSLLHDVAMNAHYNVPTWGICEFCLDYQGWLALAGIALLQAVFCVHWLKLLNDVPMNAHYNVPTWSIGAFWVGAGGIWILTASDSTCKYLKG